MWSSAHGKVQNNPQLNEGKGELTQDDSVTNGEETFYEAMGTELSSNNQTLQEFETHIPSFEDFPTVKSRTEYQVRLGPSSDKKSVSRSDSGEIPSNMDSKSEETIEIRKLTTVSWRDQSIPSKEPHTGLRAVSIVNENEHLGEEKAPGTDLFQRSTYWKNSSNTCTTESGETLANENLTDPSGRVELSLEVEQIKECSTLSQPLMSEENISHKKQAKITSEPETSRAEISSKRLKSDIPTSCAWQIDVDCFKSKKRKKLPKKYLKSKKDGLLLDHTDDQQRTVSTVKQNVGTRKWLPAAEIATQETMAKRKVLDLRRW